MTLTTETKVLWRNVNRAAAAVLAAGLILVGAESARAQGVAKAAPPQKLSLEEAVALARQQSPDYEIARNNVADADWTVRAAYGALLPTASVNTGYQYQASGSPQIGGGFTSQDLGLSRSPSYYSSSWGLNIGYSISGSVLFAPRQVKASRRAVAARTEATGALLDSDVARQYLAVLAAQDAVKLTREQLASASENLRLATARVNVGTAIPLEAKQAQVELGRAQVAVLKADNQLAAEKLRLSEKIGLELPRDVTLTSTFEVFTPPWTEADLLDRAMRRQPQLRAAAADEDAARAVVQASRTQYLPSLDVAIGFSGYARQAGDAQSLVRSAQSGLQSQITECQLLNNISAGLKSPLPNTPADCGVFTLTPAQERAILDGNNVFPFHYASQPWYAQARISLPIFSGLSRERQLQSAKLSVQDARLRTEAAILSVRTAVSTSYATLVTAQKAFEIEKANREAAAEQLTLEQERYRVGSSNFVQLQDAQTRKALADKSYVDALYGFHDALAVLENAVGEKLTTPKDK